MRDNYKKLFSVWFSVYLLASAGFSQTASLQGLLSGWISANHNETTSGHSGLRYLPTFSLEKAVSKKYEFDLEFSLNAYGSALFPSFENVETRGRIKPYRMWVRFSSSQFEARLGLQKINFGSALILRPLMWFDRIDPRDPLQITDGVYGLLLRYYFLNNANFWLWGLYGNNTTKGWEIFSTSKNTLEYGGRFQLPFFKGEIALSYHHRRLDVNKGIDSTFYVENPIVPEDRFALDGKWDIGIGIWVEGTLVRQDSEELPYQWNQTLNIGLDYTFGIGNGLNVLGEHLKVQSSNRAFGPGVGFDFSALSLSYPLGLLDNLTGMAYYDWKNKEIYRFLNWQRTYDNWSFYVIGFWNPKNFQIYQNQPGNNMFAGKGIQIMVVFNH